MEDYRCCERCTTIVHVDAVGPHTVPTGLGGFDCASGAAGLRPFRLEIATDANLWRLFARDLTATLGTCGVCGGEGRLDEHGRLRRHLRSPGPADGRRRKPLPCEGSRTAPAAAA